MFTACKVNLIVDLTFLLPNDVIIIIIIINSIIIILIGNNYFIKMKKEIYKTSTLPIMEGDREGLKALYPKQERGEQKGK